MAKGSFSVGTSNKYVVGTLSWSSTPNVSANTSTVSYELRFSRTNTGYTTTGSGTFYVTINGTRHSRTTSFTYTYNSQTLVMSGSVTVPHNADGTKQILIEVDGSTNVHDVYYTTSRPWLDTIPRASTISSTLDWTAGTQNVAVSLNRASSSFTHNIEIQVKNPNNGSWAVIARRSGIGASTTVTFTADENKKIYQQLSGYEDTQAWIKAETYNGSTYIGSNEKYGTVRAAAVAKFRPNNTSFNIGEDIVGTVSPMHPQNGFEYSYEFVMGSFKKPITNVNKEDSSITISFTEQEKQSLYAQIPNDSSGQASVFVYSKYNGIHINDYKPEDTQGNETKLTANAVSSEVAPTFSGNFTYKDTNATTVGVTGNDQYIIQGKSNLQVQLPDTGKASAKYSATISRYTASIGGVTINIPIPITGPTLSTSTNAGSTLAAGTYYVAYTWVTTEGESYASPITNLSVSSGQNLVVSLPTLPTEVTKANIYIGTSSSSLKYQAAVTGTSYTRSTPISTSGAAVPPLTFNFGGVSVNVSTTLLSVAAYDSRGIGTSVSKTVNIVPYADPVITTTAKRRNNFETDTILTLSGNLSPLNVAGTNKNAIVSAQYRYRQKGGDYSSYKNFSISGFPDFIAGNVTESLDNTLAWDVEVVVKDKLGTTSKVLSVPVGTPILFIDTNKNSIGVNQFPQNNNTFEITGNLQVKGKILGDFEFTGIPEFNKGGESLRLKAGSANHTFLAFYRDSNNLNARSGWIGYGGAGSDTMSITNSIGDIRLSTNGVVWVPQNGLQFSYGGIENAAGKIVQRNADMLYIENAGLHIMGGPLRASTLVAGKGNGLQYSEGGAIWFGNGYSGVRFYAHDGTGWAAW